MLVLGTTPAIKLQTADWHTCMTRSQQQYELVMNVSPLMHKVLQTLPAGVPPSTYCSLCSQFVYSYCSHIKQPERLHQT
jgi:hypothetical protein